MPDPACCKTGGVFLAREQIGSSNAALASGDKPVGRRKYRVGGAERETDGRAYRQMRERFDRLDGWSVHIITGYRDFERVYGRRADKRRKLSNGGMPCCLYQYFKGQAQPSRCAAVSKDARHRAKRTGKERTT